MNFLKDKKKPLVIESDVLKAYLKDTDSCVQFTAKQERELFNEYETASEDRKIEIRNIIISSYQKFVYAIAKRYTQDDMLIDVVQEGNLGLFAAFEKFDPKSGHRFSTFAMWYIRREILRYLIENRWLIKKSNASKTFGLIDKIKNKFFIENGYYPTYSEILDTFEKEYDIKLVDECDVYDYSEISIHNTYNDENDKLIENSKDFVDRTHIESEEINREELEEKKYIASVMMSCLNDKEKNVISLAFGLTNNGNCLRNEEIGEIMQLCPERIRQIKNSALKKMQEKAVVTKNYK